MKNLLYAGTELGVFASWDGGGRWISIRNNLPPVAVNDLAIHPRDNDLIAGTHGRGAWVLDNIAPLQQLAAAMAGAGRLFDMRPAMRFQTWGKDAALGSKTFTAQNPPNGAMIDFYLKEDARGPTIITVADKSGKTIRTIRSAAAKAGVNRVIWDLRYDSPRMTPETPGMVKLDPRVRISDEDLAAQPAAAQEATALSAKLNDVVSRIDDLTRQLTTLGETTMRGATTASSTNAGGNAASGNDGNGEGGQAGGATGEIRTALDQLKKLRSKLVRECNMGYRCPAMLREEAQSLAGSISNGIAPPTEGQKLSLREMTEETAKVVEELDSIINGSVRKINDRMSNQPHIATGAPVK